jgi:hypothetical protein
MKRIFAPLAVLLMLAPAASAELFILSGGGRLTGELLNPNESPRKQYVIQAAEGAKLTLDASQVKKVARLRPGEAEYEQLAPTCPDTAEAQWKLAQWCLEHKLSVQRQAHLRRVVELNPDHAEARRALGYNRVNGNWVTQDELMAKRGYVRHNGKWMLQQEIEIADKKRKVVVAQQDWCQKLKLWRGWLGTNRDEQARANIAAIKDPEAVKGLAMGLNDDNDPQVRLLFAKALGKLEVAEAARALAIAAIYDPVEELRLTCLDFLQTRRRPDVVAYFAGKLRDKDNVVVNLAGAALGQMKDPSAIGPLIDALITWHKFKIVTGNSAPGGIGASFGKGANGGGGTGLSMNNGPKFIKRNIPNQAVLDALVTLTGRNFNFDKDAWRYWYASQKKTHEALDARRDAK